MNLNKGISTPIAILLILVTLFFGSQFVKAQQEVSNPLKTQPENATGQAFSFIFHLSVVFLLPFLVSFLILYSLISLGFKILNIRKVSRSKIVVYIIVIFLIAAFLYPIVNKVFANSVSAPILYLIQSLTLLGVTFVLLKYYFSLSGRKFWSFLLYLIIAQIVLSTFGIIFL